MIINVTYGKGTGKTELAAFDAALWDAGIADYNLIILSSVIPPNSRVLVQRLRRNNQNIGDKLYVVLSKCFETSPDKVACAGLGWVTKEDGSGIFMEESGDNEENVKKRIEESLGSIVSHRKENFSPINYQIEKIGCKDKPVCAIVVAVYKNEGW